jgi:hypothetical protein
VFTLTPCGLQHLPHLPLQISLDEENKFHEQSVLLHLQPFNQAVNGIFKDRTFQWDSDGVCDSVILLFREMDPTYKFILEPTFFIDKDGSEVVQR